MAYIGAEPAPGQNREVDDISSSFNGSTTAFTLQVSGVNVSPESANNILVNLGGVLQNPGTDYTIAASTLTFTTAPASGLSFFALILGAGINTATVADDTIGASKLINTAVTAGSYTTADITVDAQGRITAAANGTIAQSEIANDAVGADQLASNAVVNDSVASNAAIAGTKISPDFGSQAISTTNDSVTIGDSIIHSGDTNTKIRFPAADTVSFETGGNERARIGTNGALSINYAADGDNNLHVGITSNSSGIILKAPGNHFSLIDGNSNRSGAGNTLHTHLGRWNGTQVASISFVAGSDTTNKDDGLITFNTSTADNLAEKMRLTSDGKLGIGTNNPDSSFVLSKGGGQTQIELNRTDTNTTGNVGVIKFTANDGHVVASMGAYGDGDNEGAYINFKVTSAASGTNPFTTTSEALRIKSDKNIEVTDGDLLFASGHGVSFSTTSDAAGMTSELLDDYEEGTWTPVYQNNDNTPTFSVQTGRYTKVGRFVYCTGRLNVAGGTGLATGDGSGVNIGGLPFVGNNDHHACLLTLGRFISILQDGGASVNTVRFNGDSIMLMTANGNEVTYTECNAFGDLTFAISYQQ